mmetsp:Transcript_111054/g.314300  ORF Transcript_111054/g.314300 Transcript_111054/m.314300 type:complete len:297 (+) Transcript_111054:546-1436(+)
MYVSSFTFIEPSRAIGKLKPRPRKMKLGASTFWQLMSQSTHSPTWSALPCVFCSQSGSDCRLSTARTWSGSCTSFSTITSLSGPTRVPHASPRSMASSTRASMVAEKAFVEEMPSSSPAMTFIDASLSRARVEPSWLTRASVRTSPPCGELFRDLRLSTASAVSPEFEMMTRVSPGRRRGNRYLNSDAYCTSTGIRAMCSMRYSASKAACHELPLPMTMILFLKLAPLPCEQAAMMSIGLAPASLCAGGNGARKAGKSTSPAPPALKCARSMAPSTSGVCQMSLRMPSSPATMRLS